MTITVRLDPKTQRRLKILAKNKGASVSDIVRSAIEQKLELEAAPAKKMTPYQAWKAIYTPWSSGESDRSERHSEIIAGIVEEKYRERPKKR